MLGTSGPSRKKDADTSSTSSISTRDITNIIEKLKRDRVRDTTKRNYYCVWKNFNEFFIKLDNKPSSWEDRLTLYVGFLVQQNKKSTTVRSYISAVKAVLADDGVMLSENRYLISSLTRACKLINDKVRTRLPIQKRMLERILQCTEEFFDQQQYLSRLYKAIFSSAYYGMLRVGEIVSGDHPVKAPDVHIGGK